MSADALFIFTDELKPRAQDLYPIGHSAPARRLPISDERSLNEAIDLASMKPGALALLEGDDAFVSRVITARHRAGASLDLCPLPWPDSIIATNLGLDDEPAKALKRVERAHARQKLRRHQLHTLRVADSSRPDDRLAFVVGAGQLYTLAQERQRSALKALGALAMAISERSQEGLILRHSRDGQPQEVAAYVMACALPRGWFDLAFSKEGGLRVRSGDSLKALFQGVARSRLPLAALQGMDDASPFERLLLDSLEGYVLDGELIAPSDAFILQISHGPTIELLSP